MTPRAFAIEFVAAVFRPPAFDLVFELVGARHAVPADDLATQLTVAADFAVTARTSS
jgi:hypothetical protein